jgi:hypothetical protein
MISKRATATRVSFGKDSSAANAKNTQVSKRKLFENKSENDDPK